jgi:transposase
MPDDGSGPDPKTVRRFLLASSPDALLAPATRRDSALDPYKAYLASRFAEGCTNAARLGSEVRDRGYRGSHRSVRRYLYSLGRRAVSSPHATREVTVGQVRRWIFRLPARLDDRDRARLKAISGRCPILATVIELAQVFAQMLRERRGHLLLGWVHRAETSEIPELRAFASGLLKDWDAVKAGLTLPWSSGAVEGHVNRIKTLKRQMYGRASLDLLRRRVLLAP